MESSDFRTLDELREKFYKEKERNEKIKSYLGQPLISDFLAVGEIKQPRVYTDYELISNLYDDLYHKNYGSPFYTATDIEFDLGLFYVCNEDSDYESSDLVGDAWAKEIEEKIKNNYYNGFLSHRIFLPMRSTWYYSKTPSGFSFPSQRENTKNISNSSESYRKKLEYMEKYSVAQYQLLLMLMKKEYNEVVAYYNDPSNYQTIEDEVNRHIMSLKSKEGKHE